VKYIHRQDCLDLIHHLEKEYKTLTSWDGAMFCVIRLKWDYNHVHSKRSVELSIPGYIAQALTRFNHPTPKLLQHPWTPPHYGAKTQFAALLSQTSLTSKQKTWVQQVVGIFLYYARAVNNTMLASIGSITSPHSTSTWTDIQRQVHHFLDYAASHPNASIRYTASQMQWWAHSDASYLC